MPPGKAKGNLAGDISELSVYQDNHFIPMVI